ncbi:MAG: hypothetical protein ACLTKH_08695 [Eubacterium sp.]
MIRKRHAKDLIENAVVATDSYSKTERIKHMYDGISCVVETDIRKCFENLIRRMRCSICTLEDIKASKLHNSCCKIYNHGLWRMCSCPWAGNIRYAD